MYGPRREVFLHIVLYSGNALPNESHRRQVILSVRFCPGRRFAVWKSRTTMNVKRTVRNLGPEPESAKGMVFGKWIVLGLLTVVSIAVALSIPVPEIRGTISESPAGAERKVTMLETKQIFKADPGVPPIDSTAPGNIETAVFALG
jgi:hypothetical protein